MSQMSLDSIASEESIDVFTGPSRNALVRLPKYALRSRSVNANSPITPTVVAQPGKILAPFVPPPRRSAMAGSREKKVSFLHVLLSLAPRSNCTGIYPDM
jgi:hypothetical protein